MSLINTSDIFPTSMVIFSYVTDIFSYVTSVFSYVNLDFYNWAIAQRYYMYK